jgi:hypothetical protein
MAFLVEEQRCSLIVSNVALLGKVLNNKGHIEVNGYFGDDGKD